MTIGRYFNPTESSLRKVVNEIIAMLIRGVTTWVETNEISCTDRSCRTAYGMARKPGSGLKRDWRKDRDDRRKREGFHLYSLC